MKHVLPAILLATTLSATSALAQTHDHGSHGHAAAGPMAATPDAGAVVQAGDLMLSGAYARATLPSAPVGGAFLTIMNHGSADDRLVSAKAAVGKEVQIHEMAHADGVMTMRELAEGLPIPAGASVALQPGGYHLMLMGLTEPLVEGQTLEIELAFEKAGPVTVRFDIQAINARGAAKDSHTAHGDAGGHGAMTGHGHGASHSDDTGNGN